MDVARVQVARGEGPGPDDVRDAEFGAERAAAVVELADPELGGRAGQLGDAVQVDLLAPQRSEVEVPAHRGHQAGPAVDERAGADGHRVARTARGGPADGAGVHDRRAHVADDDQFRTPPLGPAVNFRTPHFALPCRQQADAPSAITGCTGGFLP
jgi:hypothetical protein